MFLSRCLTFLDTQISQRLTSNCVITFKKLHLFKSGQTIAHKWGSLVMNHGLRTYKCSFSYFLLSYATKYENKQFAVWCHTLCYWSNDCMLNVLTRNRVTKILPKKLYCDFKLSFQCNKKWMCFPTQYLTCKNVNFPIKIHCCTKRNFQINITAEILINNARITNF